MPLDIEVDLHPSWSRGLFLERPAPFAIRILCDSSILCFAALVLQVCGYAGDLAD